MNRPLIGVGVSGYFVAAGVTWRRRLQGPVLSCAVSSTGGIIASGSKDRTVRLWAPNMSAPDPSPGH